MNKRSLFGNEQPHSGFVRALLENNRNQKKDKSLYATKCSSREIWEGSVRVANIGLDSFSYHLHLEDVDHPRDAQWFLQKVLGFGLNGCSFNPRHLRGWDEELIQGIGAFCDQHGLYLELTSSASDYARLCRRLILASEVGARMLRTVIAENHPGVSEEQRRVHVRFAVDNLKRLGEVAECVGVVLCISNCGSLTTAELAEVLGQVDSPFVRASFCNAEVPAAREDPVDSALTLAPYIAGVTLKDWRMCREGETDVHEGCALGTGQARVGEVYRILQQVCPKAPITVEVPTLSLGHTFHGLEEEEARVQQSVEFVKALDQDPVLVG